MILPALEAVLVGFVMGAFASVLLFAALLRRIGDPRMQGRRPAVYLWIGVLLLAAFVSNAVVLPIVRVLAEVFA